MSWQSLIDKLDAMDAYYSMSYYGRYDGRRQTFAKIILNEKEYTSYAFCSKNDQFNKKKGRLIALGRAYVLMKEDLK